MPDSPAALNNLAVALNHSGRAGEAEIHLRRAIQLEPSSTSARTNLGSVLHQQGRHAEAIECYRRAMLLDLDSAKAGSVFLYQLHFNPNFDQAAINIEHRKWADTHLAKLPPITDRTAVDKDPARKLRVGYVSADFRQHVVGRFLLPILEFHDPEAFEIYCYSDTTALDVLTDELKQQSNTWHDTAGLDDQQLASLIAQDRIDILIDLTGHMEGSRLLCFARQPAPVQISHVAYPASTGLPQIRYRITDRHLDPLPLPQTQEELLHLPHSFYLYIQNTYTTPALVEPPMAGNGYPTFGSLNSPAKISDAAIELWSSILRQVPESKLMLIVPPDDTVHQNLAARFQRRGIAKNRLILEEPCNFDSYMKLYDHIDIALDPQPYGGGITTCDALWMGVPVVSLIGQTSVGRIGASLLETIGRRELLADTPEKYVKLATALVADQIRLKEYRRTLRNQLLSSAIMNAPQYTADLETLYRQAWTGFCDVKGGTTISIQTTF